MIMKTFKNKHFFKYDYEYINVVYCKADEAPNENYIEIQEDELTNSNCQHLYSVGGVKYFGYL
jgi:signal transduction histidine kinase